MLGHTCGTWLLDEFDRNGAIEQLVEGSENATHAAVADRFFEAVSAAQYRLLSLSGHDAAFAHDIFQERGGGNAWCV